MTFLLLPLSSGKLIHILWDQEYMFANARAGSFATWALLLVNISKILITIGIKVYLLVHQSSTIRQSILRKVIAVLDASLCLFQLLLYSALCLGRLTSVNCTNGLSFPLAGVSEGREEWPWSLSSLANSLAGHPELVEAYCMRPMASSPRADLLILASLQVPGLTPSPCSFEPRDGNGSPLSWCLGHCTIPCDFI